MSPSTSFSKPPPRAFRPFPFAHHEEVKLRIETLTNMGQGLARVDVGSTGEDGAEGEGRSGCVVMVPFALPGERVRVRVYRNQKNFSEADLVAVLEPSPTRVARGARSLAPAAGACISIWRMRSS